METPIISESNTTLMLRLNDKKVVINSFFLGSMRDVLVFMDKEDDSSFYKLQSDIPLSFLDEECTVAKIADHIRVIIPEFEIMVRELAVTEKPLQHYMKDLHLKIECLEEALRILSSSWKMAGAIKKK